MIRTKEGQTLHDSWVAVIADLLVKSGFNLVFADIPGKAKPPTLYGHIPDVYALKVEDRLQGMPTITARAVIEVETEDTYNSITTLFQHYAFRKWAADNNAFFRVITAK